MLQCIWQVRGPQKKRRGKRGRRLGEGETGEEEEERRRRMKLKKKRERRKEGR